MLASLRKLVIRSQFLRALALSWILLVLCHVALGPERINAGNRSPLSTCSQAQTIVFGVPPLALLFIILFAQTTLLLSEESILSLARQQPI